MKTAELMLLRLGSPLHEPAVEFQMSDDSWVSTVAVLGGREFLSASCDYGDSMFDDLRLPSVLDRRLEIAYEAFYVHQAGREVQGDIGMFTDRLSQVLHKSLEYPHYATSCRG